MIQRTYPTSHEARLARQGQAMIADHQADLAALAEPFPATVSYAHFIKRDLAAASFAGRCTVTMPHPLFASMPGVRIVDVEHLPDSVGYQLTTFEGSQWKRYSKGELTVTWHDFGDAWAKLSSPMRWALRYLAGEAAAWQRKPRRNTLRALESRSLIVLDHPNGIITPSALALYRQHREEFADGDQ